MDFEKFDLSRECERVFEWDKWAKQIPFIEFPEGWKIKVIPPFAGAVCRFRVSAGRFEFSVYLDCYDLLGCYGSPYWEVYEINGDVFRCGIDDFDEAIEAIKREISGE